MYTKEYEKLLKEFCMNENIFNLIEQCILDEYGKRETHYITNGKYPEERNLLMKLKADLIVTEQTVKRG